MLTEHVALVNVAVQVSVFFAVLGLFAMVTLFVLLVEWWLFPEDFIAVCFEGRGFTVTWHDRLHIALVVSTLGTLTGALGGGFHGRDIVRELALFLREP